jgi:hypothetical protein
MSEHKQREESRVSHEDLRRSWAFVSAGTGRQYLVDYGPVLSGALLDDFTTFSRAYQYVEQVVVDPAGRTMAKRIVIPVGLWIGGVGVSLRVTEIVSCSELDRVDLEWLAAVIEEADGMRVQMRARAAGLVTS